MLPIVIALAVAPPQTVPEGIHRLVKGPGTMCGITASSALEFRVKVEADAKAEKLVRRDGGPRFDFFATPDGQWPIRQWVFAKSSEPSYPMVTCREVSEDKSGSILQGRQLRCDANRGACDAVFLEFAALDKKVLEEFRAK